MMTIHRGAPGRSWVLGAFALTLLVSGPLEGTARAQAEVPANAHRVGPLYVSPTLMLRDFGFDSNVYNQTNPVSDFTFVLRPTIEAGTRLRRTSLTMRSVTDLVYFARQESERSINQSFDASGRVTLRRIFFTGGGSYLATRQRPNEEIDARSRRIERGGQAGIGLAFTPKISLEVGGRYRRTAFDADAIFEGTSLAQKLNREAQVLTGSLRYAVTPLTTVLVTSDATRTLFPEAPVRDSDSRQTLVGVELNPRALISGSVNIGHQRFRPRSAVLPDFNGLVGTMDVSYRLSASTALGVGFGRNLAYSYSEHEPYYIREGYRLSVRRQIVERWDVEVSGGQFWHRYRRTQLDTGGDAIKGRSAKLLDGTLSIGYRVRRGTRVVVGLSYRDRDESVARGYENFRVGTSVAYGF